MAGRCELLRAIAAGVETVVVRTIELGRWGAEEHLLQVPADRTYDPDVARRNGYPIASRPTFSRLTEERGKPSWHSHVAWVQVRDLRGAPVDPSVVPFVGFC